MIQQRKRTNRDPHREPHSALFVPALELAALEALRVLPVDGHAKLVEVFEGLYQRRQ